MIDLPTYLKISDLVLKIVHLVPSPAKTGPVTVANELVKLLKPNAEVSFVYFDEKKGYQWPDSKRVSFSKVFSEIAELKCDILHSHTLRPDAFSAIRKFVKRNLKTISTLHNYFYREYWIEYPLIPALAGISVHHLSLKNKNALVAITPHMKTYYEHRGFKNVHYIPNTRLTSPTSPDNKKLADHIKNWAAGSTVLMTIGTANERKNLKTIIPLLIKNKSWKWVHVGDGKLMQGLTTEVRKLSLENQVYFTGFIPDGHQLLQVADVLILPSLSEGFPLVILESFQWRIPVVCNRIPSLEGLFLDELIRCDVNDVHEFVKSIEMAITRRVQLTSKAMARFEAEFSPQIVASEYLRLYESL